MSEHTPGPWGYTTLNNVPAVGVDSVAGGLICDTGSSDFIAENEANARLIAAAIVAKAEGR